MLDKFNAPIGKGAGKEDLGLGLVMVRRLATEFGGLLQLGNGSTGGWVQLVLKVGRGGRQCHRVQSFAFCVNARVGIWAANGS